MAIASILTPELREMLETHDKEGLREFCEAMHPASTADFLEELGATESWEVLTHTNPARQAEIFQYIPQPQKLALVAAASRGRLAQLLEAMASDDRVDLLKDLEPELREELLPLVAQAEREDIRRLLSYSEDSAGSVMTTDYAWFPEDLTAGEALARLRLQAPDRETIYYVYVLDSERRLVGVVTLRKLILAKPAAKLSEIMERGVIVVLVDENKEQAAQKLAHFDFIAMPVVDNDGRLVGIITHDDVIDVVVDAATEDAYRMGAVGPMEEGYLETSFRTIWRKRAFWLSCLFVAELFTFTAMTYFEDTLASVLALSLFIPLCISTGGNSGSQAATLITRAMALGQVTLRDWVRVLRHELLMGLALGLTLGVIGFARAWVTPKDIRSNTEVYHQSFQIRVPKDKPLLPAEDGEILVPTEAVQLLTARQKMKLILPPGHELEVDDQAEPGYKLYRVPENTKVQFEPVDRWRLALVISQSVAAICLWGTVVGSMLPLVFKRFGVDPGIASSPFVATFVDVTGTIIYFSLATLLLLR
ncbi:MAG: magnesium transporter [Planctomycetes bacterium]|nr:magnesium transporter [Planctomycetota bacterium]